MKLAKRVFRDLSILVCVASTVVFVTPLFVGIGDFPPRFFIPVAILLTLSVYEIILVSAPRRVGSTARGMIVQVVGGIISVSYICLMLVLIAVVSISAFAGCVIVIVLLTGAQNIIYWYEEGPRRAAQVSEDELNCLDPRPETVSKNADEQFSHEKQWFARLEECVNSEINEWECTIESQNQLIRELLQGSTFEGAITLEDLHDESHYQGAKGILLGADREIHDAKAAKEVRIRCRVYLNLLEMLSCSRTCELRVVRALKMASGPGIRLSGKGLRRTCDVNIRTEYGPVDSEISTKPLPGTKARRGRRV